MRAPDLDEGHRGHQRQHVSRRRSRSSSSSRRRSFNEAHRPEHVLEASMIVVGKAGAPPRPRTRVGQAATGNNPAEPSQCDLSALTWNASAPAAHGSRPKAQDTTTPGRWSWAGTPPRHTPWPSNLIASPVKLLQFCLLQTGDNNVTLVQTPPFFFFSKQPLQRVASTARTSA